MNVYTKYTENQYCPSIVYRWLHVNFEQMKDKGHFSQGYTEGKMYFNQTPSKLYKAPNLCQE